MSLKILELMEGARNCVRGCANVQEGEKVLILTDTSGFADPLVVEAIALACKEVNADPVYAVSRVWEPRLEEPPDIIRNAIFASNTVFSITTGEATIHAPAGRRAMMEYGVKLVAVVANTAELMTSEWARFPTDLYWAIIKKVYDQVIPGKTIRVTSDNGTDVSATVPPLHQFLAFHTPYDGMFTMFPMGVFGIVPWPPANGTIVYDALLGMKGLLKEPVRLSVKERFVTNIEGGDEAIRFRDLMDEKKRQGVPLVDWWGEIMWGLTPKASIKRGLELIHLRESELTRRAGVLHFGIGAGGRGFHWDGVLLKPSVHVDGKPVIEKGHLTALDAPEIRELAKKFGNPDTLLAELSD